jgi:sodium-dependent dicarboxylate transporter 2/3/5
MAYGRMFPDNPLDVVQYLIYMIIMGVVMTTVYVLLMRFVFRVDASKIAHFRQEGGVPPCSREQKIALLLFVAFIVLNVCNALPLGAVKVFLNKFGLIGFCIVLSCIAALIKDENGKPIANLEKLFHMCNWGQITMVGFIMVLSTYMMSSDAGITTAMANLLKPFMSLPPMIFIVFALLFAAVLTNLANNMLVIVLVMPFLVNFAMQIGMAPTAMVALLFLLSQFAIATPAASPVTAVAMTQEMADASEMTKAALKIIPFLFVISIIIGWPVAQIIF